MDDHRPTTVGRRLLAAGYFDNEPDAVLAAIYVLACADALDRQPAATPPPARQEPRAALG